MKRGLQKNLPKAANGLNPSLKVDKDINMTARRHLHAVQAIQLHDRTAGVADTN